MKIEKEIKISKAIEKMLSPELEAIVERRVQEKLKQMGFTPPNVKDISIEDFIKMVKINE